ncbi:MAG TPA: trehalase family glycosidase [Candidatus Acidoferrum sp.]|jgi:alpha,alpha-trehalase|nr:trehalase family glycosidase [Candidatus Acidoferrum sp.]
MPRKVPLLKIMLARFSRIRQALQYRLYWLVVVAVLPVGLARTTASGLSISPEGQGLKPILDYISTAWDTLTRSMTDCQSVVDPKMRVAPVLYLPAGMAEPVAVRKLASDCNVRIEHLPVEIHHLGEIDTSKIQPHGLLYLQNKYVVPGGRFNEMYGWDSYFIVRGLLRAGRVELARGMVDNFFFEVEHYGAMLNANRTYYLTRSQPPFLSSMFVDVYDALQKSGHADPAWLAKAYVDLEKDYEMWNRDPHRAGDTGLSRYYDFGEGPPAEAVQDETGFYRKVATYFFVHPAQADDYIVESEPGAKQSTAGAAYTQQVCGVAKTMSGTECEKPREFKLSSDYYRGDRSMRESGFDVSFRFGPFGAATHHFAPVCLNSLLYKTAKDLEQISSWLGRKADAEKWSKRAEERKTLITRYLWDDKSGFFSDFNLQTGQKSSYRYAATLYPLWAGLATPEQAKAVVRNLPALEQPGGLAMSAEDTGAQWDLPYGWGNIEMLAVDGLRRYGFNADADRISYEFLSMVAENFRHDGNIREKYNVVTRSSEAHVELGYQMNVVGFGWTNAAFLELLHGLPKDMAQRLEQEQNHPIPTATR